MTAVRLTDDPNSEWVRVNFRYDPALIAILKDASRGLREYDPPTRTWSIHESVAEQVVDAITAAGYEVLTDDQQAAAMPSVESFFGAESDGFDAKSKASDIISDIPAQHVGKVFRAMARALYPDLYRR